MRWRRRETSAWKARVSATPDADATLSDMAPGGNRAMSLLCWPISEGRAATSRGAVDADKTRPEGSGREGGVRLISRHANLGTSWSGLPQGDNGGWGAWFPRPP